MLYYFSYGSNLDQNDLDRWCDQKGKHRIRPSMIQPAYLNGYKLCFNYYSQARRGGAANIMPSAADVVWGLLMAISVSDRNTIRLKEGFPNHYTELEVSIVSKAGLVFDNVLTYQVVKEKQEAIPQPPTQEYLNLIIRNAGLYGFPVEYIKALQQVVVR